MSTDGYTDSAGGGVYDDNDGGAAQVDGGGVYGDDGAGGGVPQWDGAGGVSLPYGAAAGRRLMSSTELGAALGVSAAAVRYWAATYPDMPAVAESRGRRRLWDVVEVIAWLDRRWPGKYRTRL